MIGSLFSGIGLLDLGLQRAGFGSPAWQVEIDPFCRSVLARHWPYAKRYDDVRTFTPPASPVRLIAGGFPCQPYSVAGSRRGADDERALWPHFARVIDEAKPAIVVAENVPGLRTLALRGVLADLAALGFDAEWHCFSAGSVGAPHKRDRFWIAATHPDRVAVRELPGWLGRSIRAAQEAQSRRDREVLAPHTDGEGRVQHAIRVAAERGWAEHCGWQLDPSPRVDDGGAGGVVQPRRGELSARRRALGNGVVVRAAELVGRAVAAATAS